MSVLTETSIAPQAPLDWIKRAPRFPLFAHDLPNAR